MLLDAASLPDDLAAAHVMILVERAARLEAEAVVSSARLEIERLKLLLAKARREQYGQSSERGAKLVDQLELQLAELEETVAEDEAAAELTAPPAPLEARARPGRKPARRPLPENLPRERIVYPAPCSCPKCGGPVRKLGEDITEMIECVPRRWKVVEHVREKVSCRHCEVISQPPAPSHPIARGRAGPSLLALVLAAKYGQHLPLTRQSAIYAREGVEIDVSTLADWVGAATASLMPMVLEVRTHVFAAQRLHGDDTTVPVLAKKRTKIGRVWGYVRDDRPFGGPDPPAVAFFYPPPRRRASRGTWPLKGHPAGGPLAGFNRLHELRRKPGPSSRQPLGPPESFPACPPSKPPPRPGPGTPFSPAREPTQARPGAACRAGEAANPLFPGPRPASFPTRRGPPQSETGKAIPPPSPLAGPPPVPGGWADLISNNAAERPLRGVALGAGHLRRLGPWRRAGGRDLYPNRDLQAQRRRSPSLARRRAGTDA